MTDSKQTFLNLTTSVLAFAINAGISLFLTPYLISKLGNEAYGFIGLANDFVNYANILTMALNTMSSRFVSVAYHRGDKKQAETYINSVLIANIILGGTVAFAGIFLVWKLEYIINIPEYLMSDVKITFSMVFINYVISIIISILNCAPFIKNKMHLNYLRNMISCIIKLCATIALVTFFDIKVYFISLTTIICSVYLTIANSLIFKKLLPDFRFSLKGFKISAIKQIMSSGVWMSLLSLSNMLLSGLNSLLTNKFISPLANGYLSVSKSIPSYIGQLGQQLGQTFSPKFTQLYSQGKIDELIDNAKQSLKLIAFIMTVPIAGFIVYGTEFYSLWVKSYTPEEISIIQTVSVINTIPYLFNAYTYPLSQINTAVNKIKLPVIVTFITGITNILIILPFAFKGKLTLIKLSIFSAVLMSARLLIFQPIYSAIVLKKKPFTFYKEIIRACLIFVVVFLAMLLLKNAFSVSGWVSFFIAIIISAAIGYVVTFLLIFNKKEYNSMFMTIKNKLSVRK